MYLLVSCIYDDNNKTLLGYRAVNLDTYIAENLLIDKQICATRGIKPVPLNKVQFLNAVYDDFFDRLTSTGATSISDYPHISINTFGLLTKNALTVLAVIDSNGQEVGVVCFSATGERFNYSFDNFVKATERFTSTNYTLKGNRPYPNNGASDFPHIQMQASNSNSRMYQSAKGEQKPDNGQSTQQAQATVQPKRRGRPPKNATATTPSTPPVVSTPTTTSSTTVNSGVVQPAKRRGRPPKNAVQTPTVAVPTTVSTDATQVQQPAKRRGRPPKNATTTSTPSIPPVVSTNTNNGNTVDNSVVPVSKGRMSDDKQGPYQLPKDPNGLPTLGVYSLDVLKSNAEMSNSAQQKMYSALMNLRKLAPYYSTIYEAIDKKLVPGFGTFGVTEKRMFYDYTLPAELSVGEISFILIHEMMHICMLHSVRKGGRHPELWNIATDLYINSIICHDFEITFGGPERTFPNGAVIKCPPFGVFLETIDEYLDLSKDTPEIIYKTLYEENQQQQQQGGQQQQSGGQQGSQQQSGGQQGSQQQQGNQQGNQQNGGQQSNQQQGNGQNGSQQQSGQNGQNNQQNGQGQGQQGEQQDQGNQQGQQGGQQGQNQGDQQGSWGGSGSWNDSNDQQDSDNKGKGKGKGKGKQENNKDENGNDSQNGQGSQNNDENGQNNGEGNGDGEQGDTDNPAMKEVHVTYNGKKLTGKVMMDICTEKNDGSKESMESNVQDAKQTLAKIDTKIKIEEEKLGQKLTKDFGVGGNITQRNIDFGLAEGINWKALMKNICVTNPKKLYVVSKPNKNRMNLGMTIATRQKIGEPQKASNFVVAIDVSGSVSKQKLDYFLSEVNTLSKKYDVEGELVYWSTEVGDAGKFSDMKDLLKIKPHSTGGTDVKCLFDYLVGKTKTKTGKKEETKVRDIRGVFIITDGYFAKNYGEYAEYFDRRVVWLIDGNPILFDNLFGRVLGLDDEEAKSN